MFVKCCSWRRIDYWWLLHDLATHLWVFSRLWSPEGRNFAKKFRLLLTKFPEISWFWAKKCWKSQKIKSFCWKFLRSIACYVVLTCQVLARSGKSISTLSSNIFCIFWLNMTFLVLEAHIFEKNGQNFRKNAWKTWDFFGFL